MFATLSFRLGFEKNAGNQFEKPFESRGIFLPNFSVLIPRAHVASAFKRQLGYLILSVSLQTVFTSRNGLGKTSRSIK